MVRESNVDMHRLWDLAQEGKNAQENYNACDRVDSKIAHSPREGFVAVIS
jgi:hypothetical protein